MKATLVTVLGSLVFVTAAWAGDPPTSPEKKPVPGTGGSMWYSGAPDGGRRAPNMGGSVGGTFPPQPETKVNCSRNGKPVPC
jgi:hypothetical protein